MLQNRQSGNVKNGNIVTIMFLRPLILKKSPEHDPITIHHVRKTHQFSGSAFSTTPLLHVLGIYRVSRRNVMEHLVRGSRSLLLMDDVPGIHPHPANTAALSHDDRC